MTSPERNFKRILLVALIAGAAGTMAAQGCFSVGDDTKVQFAQTKWSRSEKQNLFQWTEIQSRLVSGERLLSPTEWAYLFTEREAAYSLYARALVNGMEGMVILPDRDTWSLPEGLHFDYNDADEGYATNRYDDDDWTKMEQAGAIFLPAAGYSPDGTELLDYKRYGTYWTSSPLSETESYHIQFDLGYLYYESMHSVNSSYRSVRSVTAWVPQGITGTEANAKAVKVIRNGRLLIERGNKTFDVLGTELK